MTELTVGARVSLLNSDGIVVEVHGDQEFSALTERGEIRRRSLDLPLVSLLSEKNHESDNIQIQVENGDTVFDTDPNGKLVQLPAEVSNRSPDQGATISNCLENGITDPFELCNLRAVACKLGTNPSSDQYRALSGTEIEIEPYQIDAAHTVLQADIPRFLIADEVGLGKTIEAGIILEELHARGQADRTLIVAPASLVEQWQHELADKFGREYVVFDSDEVKARKKELDANPWETADTIVTSIDYIKQEHIRDQLNEVEWDAAVFDEAHHLTARRRDGYIDPTERYRVGEIIAERTSALLLLTGTPHKGKSDQFFYLLRLLRPHLFRRPEHVSAKRVNEVMVRRLKTDTEIVDEHGNPMFPPREISTLPVTLSGPERTLYDDVSDYIKNHYAERLTTDSSSSYRIAGYALAVYQKRLVSSIRAIEASLRNHRAGLKATTNSQGISEDDEELLERYFRDPSSLSNKKQNEAEQIASIPDTDLNTGRLDADIEQVSSLIDRAASLKMDSKAETLHEFIEQTLAEDPDEKILIFTEYTDTLEYLRDEILSEYAIAQIHGDLSQEQRSVEQRRFEEEAEILVATDAAREGINLQFAHIMVNYDLPWNPIRIDQRVGRLHRYGQERKVSVYNLFIEESREDQICKQLFDKTKQMESDLGSSSDVLGTVLDGIDIEKHVEDALREDHEAQEVVADIESIVDDRIEAQKRVEEQFLIRDQFDVTDAERITEILNDADLARTATRCRELIKTICHQLDGEFHRERYLNNSDTNAGVFTISTPTILACKAGVEQNYSQVTFDRAAATGNASLSLLSANHPFVETALSYVEETPRLGGLLGFGNHPTAGHGLFCRFKIQCEFEADQQSYDEKVLDIFIGDDGTTTTEYSFRDLQQAASVPDLTKTMRERLQQSFKSAIEIAEADAETFGNERQAERRDSVSDRIENVKKNFNERINEWSERIDGYRNKAQADEVNMRAPINRARSRIKDLEKRRDSVLHDLQAQRLIKNISVEPITAVRTIESH